MPGFEIEIGKQLREEKANIKDRDQRFLIIINLKFEFTSIKPTLNCIFITDRNQKNVSTPGRLCRIVIISVLHILAAINARKFGPIYSKLTKMLSNLSLVSLCLSNEWDSLTCVYVF